MTATIKPATPLPWEMRATQESNYAAFKIGAPTNRTIAAVLEGNKGAEIDAAYIVAACNAYQRLMAERAELVAALRGTVTQCADFENMTEGCAATFRQARALLAKLSA